MVDSLCQFYIGHFCWQIGTELEATPKQFSGLHQCYSTLFVLILPVVISLQRCTPRVGVYINLYSVCNLHWKYRKEREKNGAPKSNVFMFGSPVTNLKSVLIIWCLSRNNISQFYVPRKTFRVPPKTFSRTLWGMRAPLWGLLACTKNTSDSEWCRAQRWHDMLCHLIKIGQCRIILLMWCLKPHVKLS
jgi:hypothetical protein